MGDLRIIAGAWRGRRLVAPSGDATRPTANRARETVFSMLASRTGGFTGLSVADLFAGSGALALEALSRGARDALLVESSPTAIAAIRSNITACGAGGQCIVRHASVESTPEPTAPFDVIFIDPPYGRIDCAGLVDGLIDAGWTRDQTIICVETAVGEVVAPRNATPLATRKVGRAMLHLFGR